MHVAHLHPPRNLYEACRAARSRGEKLCICASWRRPCPPSIAHSSRTQCTDGCNNYHVHCFGITACMSALARACQRFGQSSPEHSPRSLRQQFFSDPACQLPVVCSDPKLKDVKVCVPTHTLLYLG
jgi:hypothetical protein